MKAKLALVHLWYGMVWYGRCGMVGAARFGLNELCDINLVKVQF